jgi:hypothetical protein
VAKLKPQLLSIIKVADRLLLSTTTMTSREHIVVKRKYKTFDCMSAQRGVHGMRVSRGMETHLGTLPALSLNN